MVNVKVTHGATLVENSKRAGYLTKIEKLATTKQLEILAELTSNDKIRKKLETSTGTIKMMFG